MSSKNPGLENPPKTNFESIRPATLPARLSENSHNHRRTSPRSSVFNGIDGVTWWNEMVKVWEGENGGGNPCHNLECISFVMKTSKHWHRSVIEEHVFAFVDSLPTSIKRINVSDEISLKGPEMVILGSDKFLDWLRESASRRGIVVSVEEVESPAALYSFPSSVRRF
ncbi:hypothetical protein HDU76_007584 [Blyttiomyces sp. JEL0837]|nr:hypothetical protein HDU76_007584 [Blyttiomyces sp. JEL0837]